MIGRDQLHWDGAALKQGDKELARVDPEDHYGTVMWRIHFADGNQSKDVYNKTMAKENAVKSVIHEINIQKRAFA